MLECIILGDSIAVGISNNRPECAIYGKVGLNSYDFNNRFISRELYGNTVIISLGSNDYKGIKTLEELLALRQAVDGQRFFWILPANKKNIQDIVRQVAAKYNDNVLVIPELSKDNVHPTTNGYKKLAEITK
jgi:lysophospholipase L1-like esterase